MVAMMLPEADAQLCHPITVFLSFGSVKNEKSSVELIGRNSPMAAPISIRENLSAEKLVKTIGIRPATEKNAHPKRIVRFFENSLEHGEAKKDASTMKSDGSVTSVWIDSADSFG